MVCGELNSVLYTVGGISTWGDHNTSSIARVSDHPMMKLRKVTSVPGKEG